MSEHEAHAGDLAALADEFCVASIRDWTGRAARMLAARPELAGYSLATAVVLGDAARVRAFIEADPGAATRADPRTGWTALHAACASQWHRLDPDRADGLAAVAEMLLDAGADPAAEVAAGGWTPLRCAVAGAANPRITELLLERGARPSDHDLYLAAFGEDAHECLRLLLAGAAGVGDFARTALSAPISTDYAEGVRLLLDAGADPDRYDDDSGEQCPVVYAAVRAGCSEELVELLLAHRAQPGAPGPDGRSPYALAVSTARDGLAALLLRYGAAADATIADQFLGACLRADRPGARRLAESDPALPGGLAAELEGAALAQAAESGGVDAVRLMLDLGFPVDARGPDYGGTPLHAAAFAGSSAVVPLLLARGADLEARDQNWNDTALSWAMAGSGQRPGSNPRADWLATVRALLEAGASTAGLTLDPDDLKPPSPEVAEILRAHGVRDVTPGGRRDG